MFELKSLDVADKRTLYRGLLQQAKALLQGETDPVANAANLSALIFHQVPALNWAGFYFYSGGELVVGPFQGHPACVRIALGRGVCGTAAQQRRTMVVADVDEFPGHIPCDAASRSEIVVPLIRPSGELFGVLDLDSPEPGRFDTADKNGLEALADCYVATLETDCRD
jgi:L-methionine (R)-S-oxide reductase